jgi:hypothetical protein
MRILFFIAIVLLTIIPQGISQTNTPIGERIWKRELASDTKAALMIAVTLRKGDDVAKHIEPFKEALKVWWRKSDNGKQRDFLMTIIGEETRPGEIRKTVAKMISDDEELRLIFSRLGVATLLFGTPEGKQTAEFSLKPVDAAKP